MDLVSDILHVELGSNKCQSAKRNAQSPEANLLQELRRASFAVARRPHGSRVCRKALNWGWRLRWLLDTVESRGEPTGVLRGALKDWGLLEAASPKPKVCSPSPEARSLLTSK